MDCADAGYPGGDHVGQEWMPRAIPAPPSQLHAPAVSVRDRTPLQAQVRLAKFCRYQLRSSASFGPSVFSADRALMPLRLCRI